MHFTYCPHCGSRLVKKEIGDEGLIPFCQPRSVRLGYKCTPSSFAAVVNEQNEVALLRQDYVSTASHVCVAGIMKMGESAEDAVVREVKEELGLDVEELNFVKSYPFEKKEMLMLGYRARVKKKDFTLSGEVDSAEWVPFEHALEKLREGSIAWQLVKSVIDPEIN